jgi:hypothetical protein
MDEILTIQLGAGPLQYRPGSDFGRALAEKDALEAAKLAAEALLARRQAELDDIRQAIQATWETDPETLIEPMARLNPWLVVLQAAEAHARETHAAFVGYSRWAVVGNKLSMRMERLAVLNDPGANTHQSPAQRAKEIEQVSGEIERLTGVRPGQGGT